MVDLVPPPPIRMASRQRVSGLGIASFIVGMVALMLSWLPIAGCAAIPLAVIGLGLGIPALIISARDHAIGKGFPIAGVVTNVAALLMVVLMMMTVAAGVKAAAQQMNQQMNAMPSRR